VFGRPVTPASPLHDGDRIEILRPLVTDPKEGRRQRAVAARRK
jgi:putative ubiquitin-RnfH superfamily antitoxin RatB of RatAB toxin-antitoxin module